MLLTLFLSLALLLVHGSSSPSFLPPTTVEFRRLPGAPELLDGSWVLVAGDSQGRHIFLSLLRLLMDPAAYQVSRARLFHDRHHDYQVYLAGADIKLDFRWCPFEPNVTSVLRSLDGRPHPDVVVTGSGLWHMILVGDPADYGKNLGDIRRAVERDEAFTSSSSRLFWLGMPTLVPEKMKTAGKTLNKMMWEKYVAEVEGSGILSRDGGPFLLLDLGALSRECGPRCTFDGMHYIEPVDDAVVQLMLSVLLADRRAKLL